MARGRGGAGGGGGFGSSAANAADANAAAAAAKSSATTTTATALNVPASALQLFYDLASVDEVRVDSAEAPVIAIEGSEEASILNGAAVWKGREAFVFSSVASSGMRRLFFHLQSSLRLLPCVAPPSPFPLFV